MYALAQQGCLVGIKEAQKHRMFQIVLCLGYTVSNRIPRINTYH